MLFVLLEYFISYEFYKSSQYCNLILLLFNFYLQLMQTSKWYIYSVINMTKSIVLYFYILTYKECSKKLYHWD